MYIYIYMKVASWERTASRFMGAGSTFIRNARRTPPPGNLSRSPPGLVRAGSRSLRLAPLAPVALVDGPRASPFPRLSVAFLLGCLVIWFWDHFSLVRARAASSARCLPGAGG